MRLARYMPALALLTALLANGPAVGAPAADLPVMTLQMGYLASDNMQLGEPYHHFVAEVGKLSGGRITIVPHPNASVCADVDCIKDVIQGTLDIGSSSDANFNAVTDVLSSLAMPFIWKSQTAQDSVMDKGLASELSGVLQSKVNLIPLMWLSEGGARSLWYNGKLAKTPADFSGVKIRSTASRSEIATDKAWGADPVVGNPTALYTGLQQGVYQATYLPNQWTAYSKLFEVIKYATMVRASFSYQVAVMRADKFHQLPASVQSVLLKAGDETTKWDRPRAIAADRATVQDARAHGVQVYEPSPDEMKQWMAIAPKVWDQFQTEVPSSFIQDILKRQGCPSTGCMPSK